MSFFGWLVGGLGTVFGAVADTIGTVASLISSARYAYSHFADDGGHVRARAKAENTALHEKIHDLNDEVAFLRKQILSRGHINDRERSRWHSLKEEREELIGNLSTTRETIATERIFDQEEHMKQVRIDDHTTHVLQYNSFADVLGKTCPKCGRQMKIQWRRDLEQVAPKDFYWGCTGWYFSDFSGTRCCNHTSMLGHLDFNLLTDTSAPEAQLSSQDFQTILKDPKTSDIITTRMNDLKIDLSKKETGVALAICPIHVEKLHLKKKTGSQGLLDMYFLACRHWKTGGAGCTYTEKLKSGPQLAALLKSETGHGIL